MLTAEILQRRIDTAEAMQSLVKTMKALAAVNINQFEQAVRSLADYDRTVQHGPELAIPVLPDPLSHFGRHRTAVDERFGGGECFDT